MGNAWSGDAPWIGSSPWQHPVGPTAVDTELAVDIDKGDGAAYPFLLYRRASRYIRDLHIAVTRRNIIEVRLDWLAGVGEGSAEIGAPSAVHDVDMQFSSLDGDFLIDTREMQFTSQLWAGSTYYYVWKSADIVIQAVVSRVPTESASFLTPDEYVDPRSLQFLPPSVTDLKVKRGDQWISAVRSDRTLKFRAGYNVALRPSTTITSRGERLSVIKVESIVGAGEGRFPGCDVNLGVTRLGGASPTAAGDLSVSGDSCITFEPVVTYDSTNATITPGKFQIRDDCSAKCKCSDFASVANYAISVWNRYRVIAERAGAIRDKYHTVRNAMVEQKQCSEAQPLSGHTWRTPPCAVGVGFGITNVSQACLRDLTLTIQMFDDVGDPLTVSLAESGAAFQVVYTGNTPYNLPIAFTEASGVYSFELDPIEPGRMGYIFVRLELDTGACSQVGEAEITVAGLPAEWKEVAPIRIPF